MGTSLFNTTPAATYPALIKVGNNTSIDGTLKTLSDGAGNDLPIQVSSTITNFTGNVGIGTTNPSSALVIAKNGGRLNIISTSDSSSTLTIGNDNSNSRLSLDGGESNNGSIAGITANSGVRMRMRGNYLTIATSNVDPNNTPSLFGIRGVGSTSATTSLLVQNGAATPVTALQIKDDLTSTFSGTLSIQIPTSNILRFNPPATSNFNSSASIEYLYNEGLSGGPRINMNGSAVCINNVSNFQSLLGTGVLGVRTSGSGSGYAFGIVNGDGTSPETEFRNGFDYDGNLIFRNNSTIKAISTAYAVGGTLNVQGGQPRSDLPNGSGGNLALNGGLGTGTGTAGNIIFSTSTVGSSGTTLQTLTERMRIDGSGNVGVGLTAPTARLQVKGSGATSATTSLLVQNSSASDLFKITDDGQVSIPPINASTISNLVINAGSLTNSTSVGIDLVGGQFAAQLYLRAIGANTAGYPSALLGKVLMQAPSGLVITSNNAGALSNTDIALYVYQSKSVHINGFTEVASAVLNVESTTKGFLPPRMTTAERVAISSPVNGLIVFDTDVQNLCYRRDSTWVQVSFTAV